jgi:hypothetical protein
MLVKDVHGKQCKWTVKGVEVLTDKRPRSNLHVQARGLLKARFPTLQLLEEVSFKPEPSKTLYFDFFLPLRKVAIEVHGAQHYKFNSMFHKSVMDFVEQRKNDALKQDWCDINNITLVILPFDEVDNWKDKL